jgi:2-octaprenylphenol hydroxylase
MYDITIVGSGMVGLTLACALCDSGLRIAIVDRQTPNFVFPENNMGLRVSAITPASQKLFAKLDVWPRMQQRAMGLFKRMQVWDGETDAEIDFNCSEVRAETLGYIIENNVMQAVLYERAKKNSNIEFLIPEKLESFQITNDLVTIKLENKIEIITKLLIGADGANSQVRKLANIDINQHDYQQSALVATVHCELPHQQTARQCFSKGTILAFLPLSDFNLCSIVWSVATQEAERLLKLDAEMFSAELTNAFQNRLGKVKLVSERAAFLLRKRHAKNYVLPNIALIGDAAHSVHPMAGQGVNFGIGDVALLAQEILTAQKNKCDFASLPILRRYERARKSENTIMINSIDAIKKIFMQQAAPLQSMRTLGLKLTNQITPLKKILLQRAMGL